MKEIYKRRSVRSYTNENITDDIMLSLVKAGMNAPSARNKRPSEFIIIDDKETLNKLSEISPNMFMLSKCNKAILVMGKETSEFWQQDLAASTQNILLEATSLNIASCWMGIAPNENYENYFRNELGIHESFRILSIISLGYTDNEKEVNNFFDETKVYYNKFKN